MPYCHRSVASRPGCIMALTPSSNPQALLNAQLELWHHTFGFVKSMALKSALDLGIADAIHAHGGTATLPQIVTRIKLHESRFRYLRRLMRVLTVTGVFSVELSVNGGEHVYGLTPVSRLLVGSPNVAPFLTLILDSVFVSPFLGLGEWFQHVMPEEPSLFKAAHGQDLWDFTGRDAKFAKLFDNGMVADSDFAMDIVIKECGDVFHGITSLIDVAGGLGGATQVISKAFPDIKCSVLDLSHVVASAPTGTDVTYIAGDMFESIPSSNAVFLKWVLHDWGEAECVKILRNCKKAIPPRDAGGKPDSGKLRVSVVRQASWSRFFLPVPLHRGLMPTSRLLANSANLTPILSLMLDGVSVTPFLRLGDWFQHELPDPTLFKMTHGQNLWDFTARDTNFGMLFGDGMVADSAFAMDIVINEYGNIFNGVSSLIDVAGGLGGSRVRPSRRLGFGYNRRPNRNLEDRKNRTETSGMTERPPLSKAFPRVQCNVLDLPHVVVGAPTGTHVKYIVGDMFESIPSADVVFLKVILSN
ncbi:hypothetical protein EJB05_36826, partial [Eragrostis curvula]